VLEELRREVLRISNAEVRGRVVWVHGMLSDVSDLRYYLGTSPFDVADRLARWAEDFCGAYLRGDKQPSDPALRQTFEEASTALYEYYAEQDRLNRELQEERARARQSKDADDSA